MGHDGRISAQKRDWEQIRRQAFHQELDSDDPVRVCAERLNVSSATFSRWRQFKNSNERDWWTEKNEKMFVEKKPGRPGSFTSEHARLAKLVTRNYPSEYGMAGKRWSVDKFLTFFATYGDKVNEASGRVDVSDEQRKDSADNPEKTLPARLNRVLQKFPAKRIKRRWSRAQMHRLLTENGVRWRSRYHIR